MPHLPFNRRHQEIVTKARSCLEGNLKYDQVEITNLDEREATELVRVFKEQGSGTQYQCSIVPILSENPKGISESYKVIAERRQHA